MQIGEDHADGGPPKASIITIPCARWGGLSRRFSHMNITTTGNVSDPIESYRSQDILEHALECMNASMTRNPLTIRKRSWKQEPHPDCLAHLTSNAAPYSRTGIRHDRTGRRT